MLKTLLLPCALVLTAAVPQSPEAKPLALGDTLDASMALPDIDGKTWTLADFRATEERAGKVVVLDFWSIQCPWSIKYEPRLKDLAARFADKDVVFLAIDANRTEVDAEAQDPYGRIRAYAKKAALPYPVLIDRGNRVADRLAARTTPHVFVIDRSGVLRYSGGIDDDPKGDKAASGEPVQAFVADALSAVLAGRSPDPASTKPFGCSIKRVKVARQ